MVVAPAPGIFATCPVDALDDVDEPVHITFWHSMQSAEGDALVDLTDVYNASQDRVVVELQNQNGYDEAIDKYFQSSPDDRPDVVQLPEYMTQQMADANTVIPDVGMRPGRGLRHHAVPAAGDVRLPDRWRPVVDAVQHLGTGAVLQQAMFEEAGLDPDDPPITLDELRDDAEQIVDSGVATYGVAFDDGVDSGGGWFLEQWLARAGLPYANNENGRTGRATEVVFDTPEAVDLLSFVQQMVTTGSP